MRVILGLSVSLIELLCDEEGDKDTVAAGVGVVEGVRVLLNVSVGVKLLEKERDADCDGVDVPDIVRLLLGVRVPVRVTDWLGEKSWLGVCVDVDDSD